MSSLNDLNAVMQEALREQASKSHAPKARVVPATSSVQLMNEMEARLPPIRRGQQPARTLEEAFADAGPVALWTWRVLREAGLFLVIAWVAILAIAFVAPDVTDPVAAVAAITVAVRLIAHVLSTALAPQTR